MLLCTAFKVGLGDGLDTDRCVDAVRQCQVSVVADLDDADTDSGQLGFFITVRRGEIAQRGVELWAGVTDDRCLVAHRLKRGENGSVDLDLPANVKHAGDDGARKMNGFGIANRIVVRPHVHGIVRGEDGAAFE